MIEADERWRTLPVPRSSRAGGAVGQESVACVRGLTHEGPRPPSYGGPTSATNRKVRATPHAPELPRAVCGALAFCGLFISVERQESRGRVVPRRLLAMFPRLGACVDWRRRCRSCRRTADLRAEVGHRVILVDDRGLIFLLEGESMCVTSRNEAISAFIGVWSQVTHVHPSRASLP